MGKLKAFGHVLSKLIKGKPKAKKRVSIQKKRVRSQRLGAAGGVAGATAVAGAQANTLYKKDKNRKLNKSLARQKKARVDNRRKLKETFGTANFAFTRKR